MSTGEENEIQVFQSQVQVNTREQLEQKIENFASTWKNWHDVQLGQSRKEKTIRALYEEIREDGKRLGIEGIALRDMIIAALEKYGIKPSGSYMRALMGKDQKYLEHANKEPYRGGPYNRQEYEILKTEEVSIEQLKKENYSLRRESEQLKERIQYLESLSTNEEFTKTALVDLPGQDQPLAIKLTINKLREEIVYAEPDRDYIRNKRKLAKQKEKEQEELNLE